MSGCRAGWWVSGESPVLPLEASSPPGLPVDLQYLPQDKQREEEADIRKMLLEAVMLVRPSGVNRGGAEGGRKGEEKGVRAALGRASCWDTLTETW